MEQNCREKVLEEMIGKESVPLGIAQRQKFPHIDKWYKHKPESVQGTRHKKLYGIFRYNGSSDAGLNPDLVLTINKNWSCQSEDLKQSKEKRKTERIHGTCERAEKAMEYEGDIIIVKATGTTPKNLKDKD